MVRGRAGRDRMRGGPTHKCFIFVLIFGCKYGNVCVVLCAITAVCGPVTQSLPFVQASESPAVVSLRTYLLVILTSEIKLWTPSKFFRAVPCAALRAAALLLGG
jgi:hypothetical protein